MDDWCHDERKLKFNAISLTRLTVFTARHALFVTAD
jgi:hypothetical protein